MSTDEARPAEFVHSLERGLAVIRTFSDQRVRLTLSDVARATGLTRAAARRYLITLESLGYVGTDGRQFHLRPRVLALGYAFLSSLSISEIAQAHLEQLAADLHESCSTSVLDGSDIVYVARASAVRIMTIGLSVGTRLPAYCTSMGRVLIAELSEDARELYLQNTRLEPRTTHTITSVERFREELAKIHKQGYCLLDQELEDGVRSVAVPLRDADGVVVAAANTSAHAARVTLCTLEEEFLPRLLDCAREIEKDLSSQR